MATRSSITRRSALTSIAAIPAMGTAAIAPSQAASVEAAPWEKARRLADELSAALSEGDGAFNGPGGKWYAEVYPANGSSDYVVSFGNIKARQDRHQNVSLACRQVIEAHMEAREVFEAACAQTDRIAIGGEPTKAAHRRYRKASKIEVAALTDVCAFRPRGPADAEWKAKYLEKYIHWGEVTHEMVIALVRSSAQA